eukprot:gnl/MRDRNA2_/MRDRNA2_176090_c0_seq1.p1 gnl/MRDRNA2_/MRDRNA2_176090_c0~~gnl/MRDRNA2_/MRDRNA2_176090_c0_seq1.p1  ORF type:complete len:377 (-),score=39.86 gnl/MRDRNA2_/MRDRNA2_176090_c0_seq1:30-1160(-)
MLSAFGCRCIFSQRWLGIRPRHLHVDVVVNADALLAVRDAGNLKFGVPAGRPGNNHPELRRNLLVQAISEEKYLPSRLLGAAAAEDLTVAEQVHEKGFVHFLSTAFERWQSDLNGDPSYVLPISSDTSFDVGLVPFHCVKTSQPRAPGLPAEFAFYASDFETPIYQSTVNTLAEDLGIVVSSVENICKGHQAIYALTAQPGHHAGPTYYSGFCYLNNACVACALLEQAGKKPALLDLDFHGGNGSFDIAVSRDWWFRSVNCANAYPWVDMGSMGIELRHGTGWHGGYAAALESVMRQIPNEVDVLIVSLGYDTLGTDPEATKRAGSGLALTTFDFREMAACLAAQGIPILVVQEGGYDLQHIPLAALEFIRGLAAA